MRQSLLFLAAHLLGVAVCLGLGPRRHVHLCCALGFATGLAVTIPTLVLVTAAGVPYGRPSAAAVFVAMALATALLLRRRGWLDRRELRVAGAWTLGFTIVCLPLTALNVTVLTPDSHSIIALGGVLVDDAGFGDGLAHRLSNQGAFLVTAHSLAVLIGQDYLYSLAPVLGLSFAATFAVCLWHGLRVLDVPVVRPRRVVALVTAVLFSIYMVQLHLVYIHENLPSAVYLFTFAVLFWLAEVDRAPDHLPLAFIALSAFALLRIENPAAAALFLALAVLPSDLRRRTIAPGFAGFLFIAGAWYLYLGAHTSGESDMKLDPAKAVVMVGILSALFAYWALPVRRLAGINRHAPEMVAVVCALALGIAFWRKPDQMLASAEAMARNFGSWEDVGLTWYGLLSLAVVGLFVPRPPAGRLFTYGIGLYLALILMLSYAHGAYVVKIHDSAMRMSLHVLPLAFFYVGLKFALAGRARPAA